MDEVSNRLKSLTAAADLVDSSETGLGELTDVSMDSE